MTEENASQQKVTREIEVINAKSIHARPAALFAKLASQFGADILVDNNGKQVSGKNVMGLLTLEAYCGTILTVTAKGSDAESALDALEDLMAGGFDFD